MDAIPAIREGAAIRVTVSPFSTTHMMANIWAVPLSMKALRDKAKEWKILAESLHPAAYTQTSTSGRDPGKPSGKASTLTHHISLTYP